MADVRHAVGAGRDVGQGDVTRNLKPLLAELDRQTAAAEGLKARGLRNTLVIFTSDNGACDFDGKVRRRIAVTSSRSTKRDPDAVHRALDGTGAAGSHERSC